MSALADLPSILAADNTTPASATASVACGSCTACCRNELIILTERDDPLRYETRPVRNPLTGRPALAIPHKPDGACAYLGDAGCTIYGHRPEICRVFTCVGLVNRILARTTRAERRRDLKAGLIDRETWEAGLARGAGQRSAA